MDGRKSSQHNAFKIGYWGGSIANSCETEKQILDQIQGGGEDSAPRTYLKVLVTWRSQALFDFGLLTSQFGLRTQGESRNWEEEIT